jgi:hypothetical protein
MFHTLGMLEFMQLEAPTFARITLEFLSTIEFKLKNRWNGTEKEYYGTLQFRLFNTDMELSVDELGSILKLPIVGPRAVPDTFVPAEFWTAITGNTKYFSKWAKASDIHNPCFRYAQKALAYTMFGGEDSTGVATQRELFFLYSMASQTPINVAIFAANYLGRVGRATSGDISVGDMITQIADHFGFGAALADSPQVPGKNKLDMAALIQQGMIAVKQDYYSLIFQKVHVLALPAYDFINITNRANWLYNCPDLDEGDEDYFYSLHADEPMKGAPSTEDLG